MKPPKEQPARGLAYQRLLNTAPCQSCGHSVGFHDGDAYHACFWDDEDLLCRCQGYRGDVCWECNLQDPQVKPAAFELIEAPGDGWCWWHRDMWDYRKVAREVRILRAWARRSAEEAESWRNVTRDLLRTHTSLLRNRSRPEALRLPPEAFTRLRTPLASRSLSFTTPSTTESTPEWQTP